MPSTDRDAYLQSCKRRALAYLDQGDVANAIASMGSDLQQHEDFRKPVYDLLIQLGLLHLIQHDGDAEIRAWINGFN